MMRRCTVALALCLASSAFAAQCGSATIRSAADADALRKGCSTIDGTITIMASLNESISLEGVKIITGNLASENCSFANDSSPNGTAIGIFSSTLTNIHGDFMGFDCVSAANISFPNLKTVGGGFDVVNFWPLTYLDITKLDTVGYFHLRAPALRTLLHNELRSVTGAHGSKKVFLEETSVSSVDSFFRNPLDIGDSCAGVWASYYRYKPMLTNFTFGFARAGTLSIIGNGSLTVTLGGSETTSMAIANLTFVMGTSGLNRNPKLANLEIETVSLNGNNNFTDLLLPVDSMSNLYVGDEMALTRLELPPQAVNYTNFSFTAMSNDNIDFTSQFTTDADGSTRQTWYWPQKDMNSISIRGNVATSFFQTWFDYEGNFTDATGRPVLNHLYLMPRNISLLPCAPFDKLSKEGVIKLDETMCDGSLANPSLAFTRATWGLLLIAAGFHFLILR